MGRSVMIPNNARAVAYYDVTDIQDEAEADMFIEDLKEQIKQKYPSFEDCDYRMYPYLMPDECRPVLDNELAVVGISEYCGLFAVFVVPKDDELEGMDYMAEHWTEQIKRGFESRFGELRKVGTFSNGNGVYEWKNNEVKT